MKKFLALLLTLLMLCALTAPALAAGDSYEDFLADFDRWWAERSWGQSGMSVEEYRDSYWRTYTVNQLMRDVLYDQWRFDQGFAAWKSEYLAAHPDVWEGLRAGAYVYFESNYGMDSMEEYLERYHMTEDQFRDAMADEQLTLLYKSYVIERERREFLTGHGGVPGRLNVMVNGKCLTFPEGRLPYIRDGVTYVDAVALSQALGAEVAGDETGYAPLRSAAGELGCDVYWDSVLGMPVVLDPAAVVAEIDRDFTLYNRIYSNGYAGNWTLTGTAEGDLTLFDTMAGDRTAAAAGSAELVISQDGLSGTVRYDLAEVLQMSAPQSPALLPARDAVEVRMDREEGTLWLHSPALNDVLAENGADIDRETWLSLPTDELDLARFLPRNRTMGEEIYALFTDGTIALASPAYLYDYLMNTARAQAEVLGDARFTRQGDAYTLHLEEPTGFAPISDLYWLRVSRRDQTLTVRDNGDVDMETTTRLVREDNGLDLGDVAELTCRSARRGNGMEIAVDLHVKNVLRLSATFDITSAVTDQVPEITLPQGSQTQPIENLL